MDNYLSDKSQSISMNEVRLTWLGHSCFEVRSKRRLLIDPFLDSNPAATVSSSEVEPDLIAVTHGHFDHLGDAVRIAHRTGCRVVCIHELSQYLKSRGVRTEGMNIGGTLTLDDILITMTDACHSSSIDESGQSFDGGRAAGFIIRTGGVCIYHAGDTGLFRDMQMIGDLYKPDVAIVPIGGRYTMDAHDAALAVAMLRPKIAIPMHFNTYGQISQDPHIFEAYVKKASCAHAVILGVNGYIDLKANDCLP